MTVSASSTQPNIASVGSTSLLRIEVEQIDNENNDRWSGEFTSQCKTPIIIIIVIYLLVLQIYYNQLHDDLYSDVLIDVFNFMATIITIVTFITIIIILSVLCHDNCFHFDQHCGEVMANKISEKIVHFGDFKFNDNCYCHRYRFCHSANIIMIVTGNHITDVVNITIISFLVLLIIVFIVCKCHYDRFQHHC